MSISRACLCLIFLTFITCPLVLCSRSSKLAATEKKLEKASIHSPALLVSGSNKVDSSSSMTKIDDESAKKSAIAGFFSYRFPFQGWPFHKYAPYPIANPSVPSTTPGAEEEESEKVPSSPSQGNSDGGNA
ncbi:unnamed protein product [Cochlearia groenlandica]